MEGKKKTQFCPADRPPYRLAGYDFQQFFHFMSKSLEEVVATDDDAAGFAYVAEDDRPADG